MKSNHDCDYFCNVIEYDYDYLALLTNVHKYVYDYSKKLSTFTMSMMIAYEYFISDSYIRQCCRFNSDVCDPWCLCLTGAGDCESSGSRDSREGSESEILLQHIQLHQDTEGQVWEVTGDVSDRHLCRDIHHRGPSSRGAVSGLHDTCVLDCLDVPPPQLRVLITRVLDCFYVPLRLGVYDTHVLDCLDVPPPQLRVLITCILDCLDVPLHQFGCI